MTHDDREIRVDVDEGIMWIRFCRPQAMNALTPAMLQAIAQMMETADQSDNVRCVVFTGEGKSFCAGADLSTVPLDAGNVGAFVEAASRTMLCIEQCTKPVIACLNGMAIAGGLELALCADIVVAARSVEIGDGHANFGLLPGAGGSVRLARAIGSGRARYLLFSGLRMSAVDLERWGLVQQLFDDGELEKETAQLAKRIAGHSPLGLKWMKALVVNSADGTKAELLAAEQAANVEYARSHDMREGLQAFLEKRKPQFIGR